MAGGRAGRFRKTILESGCFRQPVLTVFDDLHWIDPSSRELLDRVIELARDKPIAAVGVALAMGVVLMRSPKSLAAVARAFFDAAGPDAPRGRRR